MGERVKRLGNWMRKNNDVVQRRLSGVSNFLISSIVPELGVAEKIGEHGLLIDFKDPHAQVLAYVSLSIAFVLLLVQEACNFLVGKDVTFPSYAMPIFWLIVSFIFGAIEDCKDLDSYWVGVIAVILGLAPEKFGQNKQWLKTRPRRRESEGMKPEPPLHVSEQQEITAPAVPESGLSHIATFTVGCVVGYVVASVREN